MTDFQGRQSAVSNSDIVENVRRQTESWPEWKKDAMATYWAVVDDSTDNRSSADASEGSDSMVAVITEPDY